MLARVSLALLGLLTLAGGWFWWQQPAAPPSTPPDAARVAAAEQAFQKGASMREDAQAARRFFGEAANHYHALAEQGPSANLYFNLGNASLLANRLPEAILAFRLGLRLSPDDPGLRRHLAYARSMVGYSLKSQSPPSDDPGWLPTPRTLLRWSALAAYALALLTLLGAAIQLRITFLLTGIVLVTTFGVCAWLAIRPADERPLVVVAVDGAVFRLGNGESYLPHEKLPALSKGVEGRLKGTRGSWAFIELDTGEVGWIRETELLLQRTYPAK